MRPMPSLRACGARPSAEWPSEGETPYGGRPGDDAKGGFLGGTHSVRPPIRAGRKPGHNMITVGRTNDRWPNGDMLRRGQFRRCGRAEPAPPRGDHPRVRWPCGGRPGDGARGDFLGGTRSPRPRCKALRVPRHFIPTTCVNGGPGPSGAMPG